MHRFTQKFLPESCYEVWVRSAVRNIGENEMQIGNADQLQIVGSTLASLNVRTSANRFSKNLEKFSRRTKKICPKNLRIRHPKKTKHS